MIARITPAFFCAVAIAAMAACSSSNDGAASGVITVSEPMTYAASESTKSDLGIVVWGANATGTMSSISGYDGAGNVVAKVDHETVVVDSTHHYFDTTYKGTVGIGSNGVPETAHLRMNGTVGDVDPTGKFAISLDAADNTFADSVNATRVLTHLQADLDASANIEDGAVDAGGTSLLASETLTLQDDTSGSSPTTSGSLVKPACGSIVKNCGTAIVKTVGPLLACGFLANSARVVLTCAAAGGVAGPGGAIALGSACALMRSASIVKGSVMCGLGLKQYYDNWGSNTDGFKKDCGNAASSGCLAPPDTGMMVPIMSIDPLE